MPRILFFILFYSLILSAHATHIRGGEITLKHLEGFTYQITFTLYTDNESPILGGQGFIDFGDGSELERIDVLAQILPIDTGNHVDVNLFVFEHTFPGPGTYTLNYVEANRNAEILNMDNSVNTTFSIETQITVTDDIKNSSPDFLFAPLERGKIGTKFFSSAAAVDPDGDSLSYILREPRKQRGIQVENYVLPNNPRFGGTTEDGSGNPAFRINTLTGVMEWDTPAMVGEYTVAVRVDEWRKIDGVYEKIGFVVRDFQIIIEDPENSRPELDIPANQCLSSTEPINATISANDPDEDTLQIAFLSEIFENGSTAEISVSSLDTLFENTSIDLTWEPTPAQVRDRPYFVHFRLTDMPQDGRPKTVFKTWILSFNCLDFEEFLCDEIGTCGIRTSVVTGREDFIHSGQVKIYPNPARDILILETGELFVKRWQVLDVSGKIMLSQSIESRGREQIDIKTLDAGLYLIRLHTGKAVITKRFIIE